ncbi:2-oxoglutarate dehydrogenase E1 component [Thiotrichales bacterium 19S3-7]|nr:2-oxoglutarate dehydrogenase E1 component [Thiotrichales bacterium 19S3-7]MCF6802366.1 2-oxoglutarate dehydrogenase E1 component [Thiotrichales bacterium 19S3-11]
MSDESNEAESMKMLWSNSQLSGGNSAYLDSIYESYLEDPNSVDDSWRIYFDQMANGTVDTPHSKVRKEFIELARHPHYIQQTKKVEFECFPDGGDRVSAVMDLVYAYRYVGHKLAKIDPLNLRDSQDVPDLALAFHGLSASDLDCEFNAGSITGHKPLKLKEIIKKLEAIYCGSIGSEYMHITETAEKMWLRERLEETKRPISNERKLWLLKRLSAAEGLEKYLGMRYVGQKRFSLEGGECLIPIFDRMIEKAGDYNVKEFIIGMAHRGRLNVLVNIMGKSPQELFKEFEGKQGRKLLSGDVKYHMGFSSNARTNHGDVHLSLAFNPSHLETVDAVAVGSARARQDRWRGSDHTENKVIPVQVHGDAAFSGQGIVMETLALSQTRAYGIGGSIHIVINNQVGFTTSNPQDARSSLYSTDIAKMIEAPIFHVNGDDPEAVLKVVELAFDYRMTFNKDVVIDLVCYRRHGHNEADEPSGTQPQMYQVIKKLKTTCRLYADRLVNDGMIKDEQVKEIQKDYRKQLENEQCVANVTTDLSASKELKLVDWTPYLDKHWLKDDVATSYDKDKLVELAKKVCQYPATFKLQPQVKKTYDERLRMANGEIPFNWGAAEMLAYATIVTQGHPIRMTGEDCGRGTFSHRYGVLHNHDLANKVQTDYIPVQHLSENQATFEIYDSILSEYAVLGFEYGYSASSPNSLVIWEAQFGDFANTAQVVIDQFISSAEEKWGRLSGLTLYLPHGQEGAGPEHSSARLERYLQLCANDNMQVCVPTTPAQMYHMIRRQALRTYRKPLIVMTPKSLLRHPMVHSSIEELSEGHFQCVIKEVDKRIVAKQVSRVVICTGKVYYDLYKKRNESELTDVAIVRLEQLSPFPEAEFQQVMKVYEHVNDIIWAQEEPENQGAWWMISHHIRKMLNAHQTLGYAGRAAAASPAVGYPSLFHEQQDQLVSDALKLSKKQ